MRKSADTLYSAIVVGARSLVLRERRLVQADREITDAEAVHRPDVGEPTRR